MSSSPRDQFASTVKENVPLCRDHYRLVLSLESFPPTEPGQFVQVSCRDLGIDYSPEREFDWTPGMTLDLAGRELMSPLAMLRRPFSLAGRRDTDGGVELALIHRIVGVGTDWLSKLKRGDQVYLLGPLGNRFPLPKPNARALLVGGGVGIPPMLYLAEKLAGQGAIAFCGALTRDLLPLTVAADAPVPDSANATPSLTIAEFARHGVSSVITTDDGSFGFRGFVTQALEKYLDAALSVSRPIDIERGIDPAASFIIYTCGPEPMMKRVADIAARRGIACQIAVERAMACGMGTCQSCVIKVKATGRPDGRPWVYKLACTDGPVFDSAALLW